jgi:hypothetical protein
VPLIYDPYAPRPRGRLGPAAGLTTLAFGAAYFAGMVVLTRAMDHPARAPTTNDLLLACGAFPLAIVVGMFLLMACFVTAVVLPGRAKLYVATATALTLAAFLLAFSGT